MWQTSGYMDFEKAEIEEQRSMTEYNEAQIKKMIYDKFPITKKEQEGCIQEMLENRKNRDKYRKEIMQQMEHKKHYE